MKVYRSDEINLKKIDELLNALNSIFLSTKNTKKISDKKYEKVGKIVSKIKSTWSDYLDGALLDSILNSTYLFDILSDDGKRIYSELLKISNNKDKNLSTLSSLIDAQSISFAEKYFPMSKYKIEYFDENDVRLSYSDEKNDGFSIKSSICNPKIPEQKNLLKSFDDKIRRKELIKESSEEKLFDSTEVSAALNGINKNNISGVNKDDSLFNKLFSDLETVESDYYKNINNIERCNKALALFEKYNSFFSLSTRVAIYKLNEEILKTKKRLEQLQDELLTQFNTLKTKILEKEYGYNPVDRVSALLFMINKKVDSENRPLTEEQIKSLTVELKMIKDNNPDLYMAGLNAFEVMMHDSYQNVVNYNEQKTSAVLEDYDLSSQELRDRDTYFNLYVVSKGIEQFVPRNIFDLLYDKYLKLELDNSLVIGQLVQYYLAYLDYSDKMKKYNQPEKFENWEQFLDDMLVQDGYIKQGR